MNKKFSNLFKNLIKVELVLAIFFLLVPFLLPLTSGLLLASISAYAYASNSKLFLLLLALIGYFIMADGLRDKTRRYNVALGILMIAVVAFPVGEFRILHDIVAILFFIGNALIITYFSKIIPKWLKIVAFVVIATVVGAFLFSLISLFIAESLGFLLMSAFFFIRFLKRWEPLTEK